MDMMHLFPTKVCKTCQISKSIWEYNQMGDGRYRAQCKTCWTYNRRNERSVIREQYYHQKAPNYTLDQLVTRFENDPVFIRTFARWRLRGFQKPHYPRIIRIDKRRSFTLDNLVMRPFIP